MVPIRVKEEDKAGYYNRSLQYVCALCSVSHLVPPLLSSCVVSENQYAESKNVKSKALQSEFTNLCVSSKWLHPFLNIEFLYSVMMFYIKHYNYIISGINIIIYTTS